MSSELEPSTPTAETKYRPPDDEVLFQPSLRPSLWLSWHLNRAGKGRRNLPSRTPSMGDSKPEKEVKAPNLIERAKEEIEAVMHSREKIHTKETHGMSDDIDENTPLDRVKGPSVFERAKEEIEALVQTIHPKKEPDHRPTQVKEGGFWRSLGEALQRFCSPFARKRD